MFHFSALIYNGYFQQIVVGDFVDEAAFTQYLNTQFGVYVCLWRDKQAKEDVSE